MGTTRITVKPGEPIELTDKQREELRLAKEKAIVPDEDCPAYSYEELVRMVEAAKKKREEEKKQVVALRLKPSTLKKARVTGKGYTGFLSRLLDLAIEDPKLVEQALNMK